MLLNFVLRLLKSFVYSSIYWTESSTTRGSFLYRHDGKTTQLVLGQSPSAAELTRGSRAATRSRARFRSGARSRTGARSRSAQTGCSCTSMSLSGMFALDTTMSTTMSSVGHPDVLFVWDRQSGEIWTSDRQGCHCRMLRGATLGQPHIGTVTAISGGFKGEGGAVGAAVPLFVPEFFQ